MKSTDELQQELTFLLSLPRNKDISVQISDIKKQLRNDDLSHNEEGEELFQHLSEPDLVVFSGRYSTPYKSSKEERQIRKEERKRAEEELSDEEETI